MFLTAEGEAMWSYQATLARLERAAILLEKRDARRRQWQQLYAGDWLFVPCGLRLVYDAEGRAHVAWPLPDLLFGSGGISPPESADEDDLLSLGEFVDDRGILDSFVRLADEERPEPFLEFAQRYGMLELCAKHRLPLPHQPSVCVWEEARSGMTSVEPCGSWRVVGDCGEEYLSNPVDEMRRYAVEVRAVLVAAAALHQGEPIPEDTRAIIVHALWRALWGEEPTARDAEDLGKGDDRKLLADLIDLWIYRVGLRPTYSWTDSVPYIGLGGGETLGAIIRQLAFAVAQVRGVAVCAGCGQPFVPRRRWKYCRSCGKRAADREAQRRRRARLAAKK